MSTTPTKFPSDARSQADIRKAARAARESMTTSARETASQIITDKVVRAHWFRSADSIACYLATPYEVNTWLIIGRAWRMRKRVYVPIVGATREMQFRQLTPDSELKPNRFGLLEPSTGDLAKPKQLDAVLTPLVAFDCAGNRIGMGGGYFDRTFSFLKHRQQWFHPKLVGLAFACQRVERITENPWDIRVFRVIDETA